MQYAELYKDFSQISDLEVYFNEPMKNHTTFKIGGPADVFMVVKTSSALKEILKICRENGVPFHIIGAGSNLLVGDKGVRGVVLKYCASSVSCNENIITADAGVSLASLSKFALSEALSGLEFASGIPGFLGGAVFMNAGAYGGEMKDVVIESDYIDYDGNTGTFINDEHQFGYRHSVYSSNDKIILSAKLKLSRGDKEEISKLMNELKNKRNEKQPLTYPSAGSTFKRPEGYFAAKLIEDAGLKGFSFGGAQVSEKHSGFVINTGDAKASDVIKLIEHIKNIVLSKFNVELNCEIKMIGEF